VMSAAARGAAGAMYMANRLRDNEHFKDLKRARLEHATESAAPRLLEPARTKPVKPVSQPAPAAPVVIYKRRRRMVAA
jgi:hypothetical protein